MSGSVDITWDYWVTARSLWFLKATFGAATCVGVVEMGRDTDRLIPLAGLVYPAEAL